jgi:hypothetical protein
MDVVVLSLLSFIHPVKNLKMADDIMGRQVKLERFVDDER